MPFAYADRKCPGWSVWDGRRLCCSHLSQFRGISEPGGIFSASTCHTFAAFLSQVACFRLHLSHFRGISVPGGDFAAPTCHSFVAFLCRVATLLLPPVTVSRHFRARWQCRILHTMPERLNFVKKYTKKFGEKKKVSIFAARFGNNR